MMKNPESLISSIMHEYKIINLFKEQKHFLSFHHIISKENTICIILQLGEEISRVDSDSL